MGPRKGEKRQKRVERRHRRHVDRRPRVAGIQFMFSAEKLCGQIFILKFGQKSFKRYKFINLSVHYGQ
jgi:hypothetical protein